MSDTTKQGLISIIVPVYNIEAYLPQCLDSLINQSYSNLEIICVNDGSEDNSGKVCDSYAERDSRIRVIHKENEGLSATRNLAMSIAQGEFITLVDGDDWLEINTLEICMGEVMRAPSIDMIEFGCIDVIDGIKQVFEPYANNSNSITQTGNKILSGYVLRNMPSNLAGGKFFKRSIVHSITFPIGRLYEDEIFSFKLSVYANHFLYIGLPLYNYRRNRPGAITYAGITKNIEQIFENVVHLTKEMETLDNTAIAAKFPYPLSMYANTMLVHKLIYYSHKFYEQPTEMRTWLESMTAKYVKLAAQKPYIALSRGEKLKKQAFLLAPRLYIRIKALLGKGKAI